MKKYIILFLIIVLIPLKIYAAPPSRVFTYIAGDTIQPDENTENEDVIFQYLQAGVDTYANSSIVSADITDGTIATADIANSAITTALILNETIVSADISSSAAIPYSKLSFSNNIVAGDIATSAVTTTEIASGTIVAADISASAAIASYSLATVNIAQGGTAGTTKTSALNNLSPLADQGDILYHNGTNNARLTPGTDGQFLETNGAGSDPTWSDVGLPTQDNGTDATADIANTSYQDVISVTKTITSGNTVLVLATGQLSLTGRTAGALDWTAYTKIIHGSTDIQEMDIDMPDDGSQAVAKAQGIPFAMSGIVTGLSGSITFKLQGKTSATENFDAAVIEDSSLIILEF